jgi:hypothetical protein
MIENERIGLVFAKTGSINSGTGGFNVVVTAIREGNVGTNITSKNFKMNLKLSMKP